MYKKIIIGREPSCDIVVESDYTSVSGQHATMYIDAEGAIVFEDISPNGSIVNGAHVKNHAVKVAFGAPILLGGNYPLSWQRIQPLLYRNSQSHQNTSFDQQLCSDEDTQIDMGTQNGSNPYGSNPYGNTQYGNIQYGNTQYGNTQNADPYNANPYANANGNPYGNPYGAPKSAYSNSGQAFEGQPQGGWNQPQNPIDIYQVDNIYLSSWNWGAFFLMPIWGFGNGCWWTFFLIPFCPWTNIIIAVFANRLAWKNKRWDNFYQFRVAQDTWTKGGVIGFLFALAGALFFMMIWAVLLSFGNA